MTVQWVTGFQSFHGNQASVQGSEAILTVPAGSYGVRFEVDCELHVPIGSDPPAGPGLFEPYYTPMFIGLWMLSDAQQAGGINYPWADRDKPGFLVWQRIHVHVRENQWSTDSSWGVQWHDRFVLDYRSQLAPAGGDPLLFGWQPQTDFTSNVAWESIVTGRAAIVTP